MNYFDDIIVNVHELTAIQLKNISSTDVSAAALGLVLALFSISQKFIPLCIGIWILAVILDGIKKKNKFVFSWQKAILPLLFLLLFFGVFWSDNRDVAWFDLEVKMSLAIVPILFMWLDYQGRHLILILKCFIFGVAVGAILLFIAAGIQFEISQDFKSMLYFHLSGTIHPAYLSYYLNIAITILLLDYTFGKLKLFSENRHYLLLIGLFSVFSILLLSKNGILTTAILDCAVLIVLWRKGYWKWVIFALVSVVLTFTVIYKKSDFVQDRFDDLVFSVEEGSTDKWLESTTMRLVIWRDGLKLFMDSPIYGHGTGDVKDVLFKQYAEDEDYRLVELNLNAHNQFIQTGIAVGFLGTGLLILAVFLPLLRARKNFGYAATFAGITITFFLTESVLETQAGVIGFVFFLLIFNSLGKILGSEDASKNVTS